jgi:hypothetical protein
LKGLAEVVQPLALEWRLRLLRRKLVSAFSEDTAVSGFPRTTASSGQCAAVSAVLHFAFGAGFASAKINGLSHWFNRFQIGDRVLDVDLTGDQFGKPAIQQAPAGLLYEGTTSRETAELNQETLERAARLAAQARLPEVEKQIARELASRAPKDSPARSRIHAA